MEPVPGAPDLRFAALPAPGAGLTSSNVFVVEGPDAVAVFDTGACPPQAAALNATLRTLLAERSRPVLVLLSHCHHDHCGNLDRIEAPVTVMAHWAAAKALAEGDRRITQIDLLPGATPPRRAVDVPLFLPGRAVGVARRLETPAGVWSGLDLDLGGSEPLRVLKTPGHSPCGLAVQVGGVVLPGDTPFAANPGVVGVAGWNQARLRDSLAKLRWLLGTGGGATLCLAGHGAGMPAAAMASRLADMAAEVEALDRVAPLDARRIAQVRGHAEELLDEALTLFAILAGKLAVVAHHLDALGEGERAAALAGALDVEGIETRLARLRRFRESFRAGADPDAAMVVEAAAAFRGIERIFARRDDGGALPATLAGRAGRLMADFLMVARGLSRVDELRPIDVADRVAALVRGAATPLEADAMLDSAEDERAFLAMLTAALGARSAFAAAEVTVAVEGRPSPALADPERFDDVLAMLLERRLAAGARRLPLTVAEGAGVVRVTIPGPPPGRIALCRRMMRHMMGDLDAGDEAVVLTLRRAAAP